MTRFMRCRLDRKLFSELQVVAAIEERPLSTAFRLLATFGLEMCKRVGGMQKLSETQELPTDLLCEALDTARVKAKVPVRGSEAYYGNNPPWHP